MELCFTKKKETADKLVHFDGVVVAETRKKLKAVYGDQMSEEKLMQLVEKQLEKTENKSRAVYRVQASRQMTRTKVTRKTIGPNSNLKLPSECGWACLAYSVLEKGELDENSPTRGTGYVTLTITRTVRGFPASVYYETKPGDGKEDPKTGKPRGIAKDKEDYEHTEGR